MKTRVSIDRKLLIALCLGCGTVLRNPGNKKRANFLRKILDLVDKDAKPVIVDLIAKEVVKEWRKWHKPGQGDFISDGLITQLHKLDNMFPGKTASQIVDKEF
jgi:hypothetical protein